MPLNFIHLKSTLFLICDIMGLVVTLSQNLHSLWEIQLMFNSWRQSSDMCLCSRLFCHTLPFLDRLAWTRQRFTQLPEWHFEGTVANYSTAAPTEDTYHHLVSKWSCWIRIWTFHRKKKQKLSIIDVFQSDRLKKCHSPPIAGDWQRTNSTTGWEKHRGMKGETEGETAPALTLICLLCR